ncbi:prephenate dehydrogenase [Spongiivirga citrea]|uniref:Prephenate dehydrogenase n=1 Tax=Spongiivirga citrea TaxID=1481457 RepID=A0A6M0CLP0_9FLAO|nr:prephenate dehydrogenase [Spongiivirga citrea]NER18801.1 prephenate dehydrogenase [Spongiivirga citrea]
MNIYIIGIGLIGGSFALDIKATNPDVSIFGIDANPDNAIEAKKLGVIDEVADFNTISNADVVVVAIPVDASIKVLQKTLDLIDDNTLIIEVGSTKVQIVNAIEDHPKRRNLLLTHPIAGTEFSGPSAAIRHLYKGKTNIICEIEKTAFKLQERALKLFADVGMRIRYMDPVAHDKHIAYVSHLSHISSFMLGKTVIEKEKNERDIFDMAGSGFESTVRLAKSSPAMWTPIFEQNKDNVVETLEEYIANLEQFKQHLIDNNFQAIYNEMENTNHIKEILKGITINA